MKKYKLLFIFATVIFLSHYLFSGQAVYGDGIDYWAYLPSIYFDRDLDFENQYRHNYNPVNNNRALPSMAPEIQKTRITSIGKTDNPHPPGTALLWFPAFILSDFISLLCSLPRNGFADIYQIFTGLWSIGLVMFALRLNEVLINIFIKDKMISSLAIIAIFLATPLFYYGSYDVLNSHFASFILSSLFWYLLLVKPINTKSILVIGATTGLATLVRLQETLLLIPAIVYFYWKRKHFIISGAQILIAWTLITLPLIFFWIYLYGSPIPETYTAFGRSEWFKFGSLFHYTNGLFFRTPILLISMIALKKLFQKEKQIFWLLIIFFVLQFTVITFQGGWEAPAYGGRMYISLLPLFSILIGYTLKIIKQKWSIKYALFIVVIFSILNFASIASYVLFEKEVNSGQKRGLEEQTQEKLNSLIKIIL